MQLNAIPFSHIHTVVHWTQSSDRFDKWIRGWKVERNRDRQKEGKKGKEESRELSGRGERRFFGFLFCFQPP